MKYGVVKTPGVALTLAALLVVVSAVGRAPLAEEEWGLLIHKVGGGISVHFLPGIERMSFEGDSLVIESGNGVDAYAAENIERIEFNPRFSGVRDPDEAAALAKHLSILKNMPNPFSPETRIEFDLPAAGWVTLSVYSPNGRLIRKLVNGEREPGSQSVRWDGSDDAGRKAASGVYFYDLVAPGVRESRQMIMLP
ncbi:FlgD immunoglobulin-like domain containing protein [Candidatus Eisenbacteria bacterium]|uniref:FlgD immunoglobulin-like domain containing protein n=1 Tax=Eiseniibacteriota bacterium TaxID=2212470 RepID=A0ABV6YLF0_UNCEI